MCGRNQRAGGARLLASPPRPGLTPGGCRFSSSPCYGAFSSCSAPAITFPQSAGSGAVTTIGS
jgi:hypothetical protein